MFGKDNRQLFANNTPT